MTDGPQVASMNPDNMISAGLPDDFDGTITRVRLTQWDYDGSIDEYVLAALVTITPDEDSGLDEFDQYYSAGKVTDFAPSTDAIEPCLLDSDDPSDWEGEYALKVGKRDQLNNNSNWAHWIGAAVKAGFDVKKLQSSVACFEGVTGHWNRIGQQKRSGLQDDGKERQILVLTEITAQATKKRAKKTTKSKASKKTATDTPQDDSNDVREHLSRVVLEALANADGIISKTKLPALVIKQFDGSEKAEAVRLVSKAEFLSGSDLWTYDSDDNTLSLA